MCFDRFEVDLDAGHVLKRGIRIRVRDQVFRVLASLLERPGQLVTREELRRRLWPDGVFVGFDNSLNIAVARLRTALGESARRPHFIETIPRRGYRFVGRVFSSLPPASASTSVRRIRLAVLPFLSMDGDPAQEGFCDAMTDDLITELAGPAPDRLAVIARTTAMRYKRCRKDAARIGRELCVDYLVEGAVRRTGDRVAVNVQLIQATAQTHLFARKYEVEAGEVFRIQRTIALDILSHLPSPDVEGGRHEARRTPTEDVGA